MLTRSGRIRLHEVLAREQKHVLVEAADHGDFLLRLLRLGLSVGGLSGRRLLW